VLIDRTQPSIIVYCYVLESLVEILTYEWLQPTVSLRSALNFDTQRFTLTNVEVVVQHRPGT
jgi:hypothetical protein